jgi:hypothetical protein
MRPMRQATTAVAAIAVRSPDANPLNMALLPGDQRLVWCYKRWFRIIQGWDIWLCVWCIRWLLLSSSWPASIWTFALLTLPCLGGICCLLKWNMSFDVSNAFDKSWYGIIIHLIDVVRRKPKRMKREC